MFFFVVLITFNPFFLHGEINLFEFGLYLPGIDAILHGQIPYRDFIHLRGPLELYIPAFFMTLFGEHFAIVPLYFYVGTVITLIFCVLIAKEVLKTRIFFYLAIPVLIARAFPRVSYTLGGGIRFGYGLIVIFCLIKFLNQRKLRWALMAGISSAFAVLTSIEIGLYSIGCFTGILVLSAILGENDRSKTFKGLLVYWAATITGIVLFIGYLWNHHALGPFFDTYFQVVTKMLKTFPQVDPVPRGFLETLGALINPVHENFKQLTPIYCYIFVSVYLLQQLRQRKISGDLGIAALSLYGMAMYITAFKRSLWGPLFEMALQPEKIIFFVLLERAFFFLKEDKEKRLRLRQFTYVLLIGVILSSIIYPIQRYNKRFIAFQYIRNIILGKDTRSLRPLSGQEARKIEIDRMKGLVVPAWQAEEFEQVNNFLKTRTHKDEPVLFFPELGVYHFIVDRPFAGRFPMVTLSWIGPKWHEEFMAQLRKNPPAYAVVRNELPDYFSKTNFACPPNKRKYDEAQSFIEKNYRFIFSTKNLNIYEIKKRNQP